MKGIASRKEVMANIVSLLSGTALARGISAITLVIIARQIGPDAFGQYSATMALVAVSSVLFSVGLDGWLLYEGGRKQEEIGIRLGSALSLKVLLGSLWLVGMWTLAPRLNPSSFPSILIVLGSSAYLIEEIGRTTWSSFKACLRNDLTLVLMIILQGIFLGVTLWFTQYHVQEPAIYLGGRFLAACIGVGASLFLATRKFGFRPRLNTLLPSLRGALPFAGSVALAMIYGRADLTIVAFKLGKAAAGVYGPAITLTNALFLIPAAVYGVLVPLLSRGYAQNRRWVKRLAVSVIPAMLFVGFGLGIGLTYLSHPLILFLYGTRFRASADVLAILGGVLILRCPNTALAAVLVSVGWQVPRVGVQGVSAVLNVLLNFLLVQKVGVIGVAKVYVLTEAILFLGYLVVFVLWMRKEKAVTRLQESF